MKTSILFVIIAISILNCNALYAEEIVLTLDEAVIIACRDNRDILLKAEDVKKAKLEISGSRAEFFPDLDFTATHSDTRGYYSKDLQQTTTQTTLKQYLYKGGKTINTLRRDEHLLGVKQALADKEKIETVLSVKKVFYALLLAQEFSALNAELLDNAGAHLEVVKKRYQKGQASAQDILSRQSSVSSAEELYEASLNQIESSQIALNNLLYLRSTVKVKPAGRFVYEPKDIAFDKAFLTALKQRPEIRQYEAQENADKKSIEIAKADRRPSVYASWDYYTRDRVVAGTAKNWNDYNVIGITFSWPIFDIWKTKSKVESAIADSKETRLLKEKTAEDIALELKDAYIALKDALAKIQASESDLRMYNDNFRGEKERYALGLASKTDLNDAKLKCEISEFNKKEAIYDYIIAGFSFNKGMGGI